LCYWYPLVMSAIVPFFAIVNQLFLAPLLNAGAVQLSNWALGIVPVSTEFLREGREAIAGIGTHYRPVFSGHMSGGVLSKALASEEQEGGYAVAFEAPVFQYSYIAASTQNATSAEYETVNVYSDSSLFSALEEGLTMNLRLPRAQSVLAPASPYDTLCLIAAGCTETDEYDGLCEQLIGKERFVEFFELWLRKRNETIG
jgi:hypothetical protein